MKPGKLKFHVKFITPILKNQAEILEVDAVEVVRGIVSVVRKALVMKAEVEVEVDVSVREAGSEVDVGVTSVDVVEDEVTLVVEVVEVSIGGHLEGGVDVEE